MKSLHRQWLNIQFRYVNIRCTVLLFIIYIIISIYLYYSKQCPPTQPRIEPWESPFERNQRLWRNCMEELMEFDELNTNEIINRSPKSINVCGRATQLNNLRINKVEGREEEVVYFVQPTNRIDNGECTIVTIGVNQQMNVEKKWKTQYPHCVLIGFDGPGEGKREVYNHVGEFYELPTEKLEKDSEKRESTKKYDIKSERIFDFLREKVNMKSIDVMLINSVNTSTALFDFFLISAKVEEEKMAICQVNIKIKLSERKERTMYAVWLRSVVREERFLITPTSSLSNNHLHLHLLNIQSIECVNRYRPIALPLAINQDKRKG